MLLILIFWGQQKTKILNNTTHECNFSLLIAVTLTFLGLQDVIKPMNKLSNLLVESLTNNSINSAKNRGHIRKK